MNMPIRTPRLVPHKTTTWVPEAYRKSFFLGIAAIMAACIAYGILFFDKQLYQYQKEAEKISRNISREAAIAEMEREDVKKLIINSGDFLPTFGELLAEQKYPILVIKVDNNKSRNIILWTDHSYALSTSELEGYFREKLIRAQDDWLVLEKSLLIYNNREYEIISVIPLVRQVYFTETGAEKSWYNQDIFTENQFFELSNNPAIGYAVGSPRSKSNYLFSILTTTGQVRYSPHAKDISLFFIVAAIAFCLTAVLQISRYLRKIGAHWKAFILFAGSLGTTRFLLQLTAIPKMLLNNEVFSSSLYASSAWVPSLGDLLLHLLLASSILFYFLSFFSSLVPLKKLLAITRTQKRVLLTALFFTTFLLISLLFHLQIGIPYNSKEDFFGIPVLSLDITESIGFQAPRIVALGIFILASILYISIFYVTIRLTIFLSGPLNNRLTLIVFLSASLVFFLLLSPKSLELVGFNANALFFIAVMYLRPFRKVRFRKTDFNVAAFLMLSAGVCAIVGAAAIMQYHQEKDLIQRIKFAESLQAEDPLTEYYLGEMNRLVAADHSIFQAFTTTSLTTIRQMENKLKEVYLNRYLDRYTPSIYLYDSNNEPFHSENPKLASLIASYQRQENESEGIKGVYFFLNLRNGTKTYWTFIQIIRNNVLYGTVVIGLKESFPRPLNSGIFPRNSFSLKAQRTGGGASLFLASGNHSYALFENETGEVLFAAGDFNYSRSFFNSFRQEKGVLSTEKTVNGHHHLLRLLGITHSLVVSAPEYPINNLLANTSFLFLTQFFLLIVAAIIRNLQRHRARQRTSYATRLQLYINIGFFTPLIIICFMLVYILQVSNNEEIKAYYLEKALNVSSSVSDILQSDQSVIQDYVSSLESKVKEISKLSDFEIMVYNPLGKLIATSDDVGSSSRRISGLINPKAFVEIVEDRQNKLIISEKIGELAIYTAYVSVRTPDNSAIRGIVAVPFFGARYKFDQQIIQAISSVLIIFTFLLILVMILTYLAAKNLLNPLREITRRMQQTSLSASAQPISSYDNKDEFAIMFEEYNRMLKKMQDSSKALAEQEKESAWRQMAKQVAHEIKNPLTPMQLHLQMLYRRLGDADNMTAKSINMLLSQIQNLTEIATSFANLGEMPLPKEEVFDVAAVLRQTVMLHAIEGQNSSINEDIPTGNLWVNGDKSMISRTFTNLIINAIQAVPRERTPQIFVSLTHLQPNHILIEIKDNGTGIPEEMTDKIFTPNFSTKTKGSGLGLAIARRSIEHAGGSIWFETQKDIGTSFFIRLPLSQPV